VQGERAERRLAAILAADVAGYSRLIEADEEGTLNRLKALRAEIIDPKIAGHKGRIVKTTGDGLLVEFASVVDAVRCAAELQAAMAESNGRLPPDRRIDFRIGIHQGDIVVEDGDIFGDGVNIAARLEGLAEPGGICVSARVREDTSGRLDLAFEDIGEQQLRNIARPIRGYRVRSPLPNPPVPGLDPGIAGEGRVGVLPLPDKPSIAVLPFQNMSGDPEQEYFADGVVEEIITALSRIPWLFVIARNSSFTYKGQAIDVKRVGRELGVRYVLEGSVRRGGGRVRITGQLIEADTGKHLWADRFDGSMEEVFDLQDQVATSVAGVIEPTLQIAEDIRAASRPTHDLTAHDLYMRATTLVFSRSRQIPEAVDLLGQAVARDPNYGPALALLGLCSFLSCLDGNPADFHAERRKAVDFARRALRAAENDPTTLANAAITLAYGDEDITAMLALVDRALAINPSSARAWHAKALLNLWAGETDLAQKYEDASVRLSPRVRTGWALHLYAAAHLIERRYEDALPHLRLAIEEEPGFMEPYRLLAACYAHLGRLDEAREVVARLRAVTPLVVPPQIPYRKETHRAVYFSGLRLAAGEA
jgi:TolB-like protein/class 3 adenylate cyclase/tetratricopeptide (TPR) repeat protein